MKLNNDTIASLTKHDMKHLFDMYARQNGYLETPPNIMDFITNPYYLGDSFNEGKVIFDFWKKQLIDIYPTPFYETNKYKMVVFSGATGTGKTTTASIMFLYDLARVLCMEKPQEKFGMPTSAKIYFTLTNATTENVESINFDPVINMIRQSPFFRAKFNNTKSKTSMFVNNIDINMASRKYSLIGKNIYSASSDEINVEVTKQGSKNIVTEMYNRINSRFLLSKNKWPGTYSLISSATTESALIETIINNAEEKDDESFTKSDIKIVSEPRYEILKHKTNYSGKTFDIFIGDYQSDPFIINDESTRLRVAGLDQEKIYKVPVEHREEFSTDIYAGIRDVIGKAVSDVRTFIPFKEKIKECLSLPNEYCQMDTITLSKDDNLIDFFDVEKLLANKPGAQRVIGLDIAISGDGLGLSSMYISDAQGEGELREQSYEFDFTVAVRPPKGHQLQLYQIREFIIGLKNRGMNIEYVVTDSYQSTDTIQLLKKQGIEAILNSVDRKKDAYYVLRSAIMEGRLKIPNNKILYKELVYLKENDKKIDHPDFFPDGGVGSKDIADSVCNALFIAQSKLEYIPYLDQTFIDDLNSAIGTDMDVYEKIFGAGVTGTFVN